MQELSVLESQRGVGGVEADNLVRGKRVDFFTYTPHQLSDILLTIRGQLIGVSDVNNRTTLKAEASQGSPLVLLAPESEPVPAPVTPQQLTSKSNVDDQNLLRYLPLVDKIARKMHRKLPPNTIKLDDLNGYGVLGLMEALNRLDPNVENPSAFLSSRIRGAMLDHIRAMDPVGRRARSFERELDTVNRIFRPASDEERAVSMGLTLEEFYAREAAASIKVSFLDAPLKGDSFSTLHDVFGQSGPDLVESQERDQVIRDLVGRMANPRHCQVLQMYYFEGKKLREIGALFGVSESRACQILSEAERKLKRVLARSGVL